MPITPTTTINPATMTANWTAGLQAPSNVQKLINKYNNPKAAFNANPTAAQASYQTGVSPRDRRQQVRKRDGQRQPEPGVRQHDELRRPELEQRRLLEGVQVRGRRSRPRHCDHRREGDRERDAEGQGREQPGPHDRLVDRHGCLLRQDQTLGTSTSNSSNRRYLYK